MLNYIGPKKCSLIYKQSIEAELDYKILHFYVRPEQLISVDLNQSLLTHIDPEFFLWRIEQTENAVDGFLLFSEN
jgi:magnesium transporter